MKTTTAIVETPPSVHVSHVTPEDNVGHRVHNVLTTIHYYRDPGDGSPPMPVYITKNTVKNERPMVSQQVVVRDVTDHVDIYTLDLHGFQFRAHESRVKDFDDEEMVKTQYYAECEQLLKNVTGASRVLMWDHKVRRGPSNWHKLGDNNRNNRGPLYRAHVDQSYDGAEIVLRRHLPDEADELVKGRYQIINIWRPLKTVYKDPLAVADAASIPQEDLLAASIIYPRSRDETWTIKPSRQHRWCFKYAQRPDEVLFIKCFDSRGDVARRAPHTAFVNPDEEDKEARESIEARALVFYDE
ncbi:hypothetical protein F4778DRAFT_342593 [Xylariomycetidae sp. FL2044]|nr:hypothetical protein F4778DRAFT_342593 [Xylariomycetidae sp. FL2044]